MSKERLAETLALAFELEQQAKAIKDHEGATAYQAMVTWLRGLL